MHAFLQTGYVESRGGGWKSAISTVECSIVIGKKESWRTDIRECVSAFLSLRLSHYIMSQYIQCSLFTDNPRLWLTRWSFIEFSSLHSNPFFFFCFSIRAHVFHVSLPLVSLIKYSQALLAELFASSSSKNVSTRSRRGGYPAYVTLHPLTKA